MSLQQRKARGVCTACEAAAAASKGLRKFKFYEGVFSNAYAFQAVQAAAAQAKQLAARKKCELGLGVAVTAVDGRLPPAQSLVTGALFSETETDQLNRTCFLQGFPQDVRRKDFGCVGLSALALFDSVSYAELCI